MQIRFLSLGRELRAPAWRSDPAVQSGRCAGCGSRGWRRWRAGGRGARCAPLPAVGGGGGAAGRLWQFLEPPLLPAGACRGRCEPAVPPGDASRMEAAAPIVFIGARFAAGVGRDCHAVVIFPSFCTA